MAHFIVFFVENEVAVALLKFLLRPPEVIIRREKITCPAEESDRHLRYFPDIVDWWFNLAISLEVFFKAKVVFFKRFLQDQLSKVI